MNRNPLIIGQYNFTSSILLKEFFRLLLDIFSQFIEPVEVHEAAIDLSKSRYVSCKLVSSFPKTTAPNITRITLTYIQVHAAHCLA